VKLFKSPLRRTTAVLAGAFLGMAGAVTFAAAPASAHAPSVSGTASCVQDGSWKIDWLFGNDYSIPAIVRQIELDPQLELTGEITKPHKRIPRFSAGRADQEVPGATEVPADVDSVHIKVWLTWPLDGYSNFEPAEATVTKPAECTTPTTPPSETPTTPPSETPSTPPSETPSTPPSSTPPTPSEPTPIVEMDCTTMTIGLDNPADGIALPLHFKTSKGEERDLTIAPGEKKTEKFSATPGFTVEVSLQGASEDSETIAYEKPAHCDTAGGSGGGDSGGLPVTGAAAGTIAGGAAVLLAIGGVLFFMARRRKVKFTA
jgi:hypothetical protein